MENIMMLPASYCVMNEEEMTYTSGGANIVQAAAAVFIPIYGWIAGVSGIRDYRKAHPDNWTSTGSDALSKYMDKSFTQRDVWPRLYLLDCLQLLHRCRPVD